LSQPPQSKTMNPTIAIQLTLAASFAALGTATTTVFFEGCCVRRRFLFLKGGGERERERENSCQHHYSRMHTVNVMLHISFFDTQTYYLRARTHEIPPPTHPSPPSHLGVRYFLEHMVDDDSPVPSPPLLLRFCWCSGEGEAHPHRYRSPFCSSIELVGLWWRQNRAGKSGRGESTRCIFRP
jgi:hypothetical protein